MIPLRSSHIHSVDWANNTLIVRFRSNGAIYSYADVPKETFIKLLNAPSPGTFLNKNIKNTYQYKKHTP